MSERRPPSATPRLARYSAASSLSRSFSSASTCVRASVGNTAALSTQQQQQQLLHSASARGPRHLHCRLPQGEEGRGARLRPCLPLLAPARTRSPRRTPPLRPWRAGPARAHCPRGRPARPRPRLPHRSWASSSAGTARGLQRGVGGGRQGVSATHPLARTRQPHHWPPPHSTPPTPSSSPSSSSSSFSSTLRAGLFVSSAATMRASTAASASAFLLSSLVLTRDFFSRSCRFSICGGGQASGLVASVDTEQQVARRPAAAAAAAAAAAPAAPMPTGRCSTHLGDV